VEEARRRPGELTLVTLGPMTNLALAVLRERPSRPSSGAGDDGRQLPVTRQHGPDHRVERLVDPDAARACIAAFGRPEIAEARRTAGLPPLPLAMGST